MSLMRIIRITKNKTILMKIIVIKIVIAITTNKIKLKILGGIIQLIIQKKFTIADGNFERELFGNFDENVKLIEKTLNIDVILREGNIILIGEEKNVDSALKLMNELHQTVSNGKHLDKQSISYSLSLLLEGSEQKIKELEGTIVITQRGKAVQPKTLGQKEYIKLIENNDITFGVGPAGTGKTYLAVAMAVKAFKRDEVSRIILTRPAVEAGESLGFLPGDLKDKVDPYLRPLYDALFEMLGADKFNKYLERGTIEVAPLAFMRGRTLDNSFIILDEAQNTTSEQMKMFLTRLGFGSKAVVTGDVTQTDLPQNKKSGLIQATEILKGVPGIGSIMLTDRDVVRHELVQRIIRAYEKHDKREEFKKEERKKAKMQEKTFKRK
ncbi:PhoH-like protein [Clostridioides difficile E10]|nr:PhoH-like protein [Clostridioides difficile T5]CCK98858.1 PhoH-like protein [Clostridioides difficile E10]